MGWLKTRPKRTEENTKKFEGFNKSIGEAQKGVTEAEVAVREFH